MNCRDVEEREILEQYLLDRLTEPERDDFERHYFECASCFSQLQNGLTLKGELQRQPLVRARAAGRFLRPVWAPAFALLVLVFAAIWWVSVRNPGSSKQAASSSIAANPGVPAQTQMASPAAPSFEELARVEAPPYSATVLRGAEDESDEAFRKAMQRYAKGDYAGATPGLLAAAQSSPRSPKLNFYLGACYLLTGQTESAIEFLRKTISLGDTAYGEQAHFYLAKAYLKSGQVPEAKAELQKTVRLGGSRKADAGEILHKLQL